MKKMFYIVIKLHVLKRFLSCYAMSKPTYNTVIFSCGILNDLRYIVIAFQGMIFALVSPTTTHRLNNIEGLVQIVTTSFYIRSYNSFAPSPQFYTI